MTQNRRQFLHSTGLALTLSAGGVSLPLTIASPAFAQGLRDNQNTLSRRARKCRVKRVNVVFIERDFVQARQARFEPAQRLLQ